MKQPAVRGPDLSVTVSKVKPIRDRSFSANLPQVQTQTLYEKSKYDLACVQCPMMLVFKGD